MSNGTFITVEGIHAAGKTAVTREVIARLESQGLRPVYAQDQAGTELGRRIRSVNLESGMTVDVVTEALLAAAARREVVAHIIKPQLRQAKIVISERNIDAYYAFGFARVTPLPLVKALADYTCEGIEPDLTILLDLAPADALARVDPSNRHRVEREPLDFHERLREGYLLRAEEFPARIRTVNASVPFQQVFEQVWSLIAKQLQTDGRS
jgi:dTMP kinase